MSYIKDLISSLGYKDILKLHYLDPSKDFLTGIKYLGYDKSTFNKFLELLMHYKVIYVFTNHDV